MMARILPLILVTATISSSAFDPQLEDLNGKEASWIFDFDMDGIRDARLSVEGIIIGTDDDGVNLDDFRCQISYENLTSDGEVILSNSYMSWNGTDLVKDDIQEGDPYGKGIFAGTARSYVEENQTVNGVNLTVAYDRTIGLLLCAYLDSDDENYYLRIESTNAFFNMNQLDPFILIGAVIIGAFAVLYTVVASVNDKKKKMKRACFEPGCL